jgi:glycosyltransferase involved in cell wall biosynthesis
MKIVQVISSLGNGGAEKLVVELSNELALTHQVTLVSFKNVEDWMYHPKKLNDNVELLELGKTKRFDFRIVLRLFSLLRDKRPDVVHVHLNSPLYYFLPIILFHKNIKFVFTIHNTFEIHKALYDKLCLLPYYKRVVNICLSESIQKKFKAEFPDLKFYLIENGIKAKNNDEPAVEIDQKIQIMKDKYKLVCLFVGRLSYSKNIPLLLEAFSHDDFNDVKLLIVGDGDETIKNTINKSSEETFGRIEYIGRTEHVMQYMENVDALVMTSRNEGMPIVLIEALSAGLPIVSTPAGGVPDIIKNNMNGFLTKGFSTDEIISSIKKMTILNDDTISRFRQNNKKLFKEKYSIESCAKKHEQLYRKLTHNDVYY